MDGIWMISIRNKTYILLINLRQVLNCWTDVWYFTKESSKKIQEKSNNNGIQYKKEEYQERNGRRFGSYPLRKHLMENNTSILNEKKKNSVCLTNAQYKRFFVEQRNHDDYEICVEQRKFRNISYFFYEKFLIWNPKTTKREQKKRMSGTFINHSRTKTIMIG